MKEGLISFETAKLAKEKGFDICVDTYLTEKNKDINRKLKMRTALYNFNQIESIFSRPTQSLLQKWLREVHKVNISVTFYDDGKNQYWTCHIHCKSSTQSYVCGEDVYEDALERGLFEGLKYIK